MANTRFKHHAGTITTIDSWLLESMFKARKRMFVDELKWDLAYDDKGELDQFDTDSTEYILVTENGYHSASLRLHKNKLCKSLMQAISKSDYPDGEDIWELSRFVSSNYTISTSEYVLILASFMRLLELKVNRVYTTLDDISARKFRMIGICLERDISLNIVGSEFTNYSIKTDAASLQRFYRSIPNRDAAILRKLGSRQNIMDPTTTAGIFYPIIGRSHDKRRLDNDI